MQPPAISYKLRVEPEDFRVDELHALPVRADAGRYRVYRLTKRGWNTTDALHRIAKRAGISRSRLHYGGRKDRHALTTQTITIEDGRDLSFHDAAYSLEALGFSDEFMGPRYIEGNRFRITLRSVSKKRVEEIQANLEELQRWGVPNYFDDQRFGSYDPARGFAARDFLDGDFERGLQTCIAAIRGSERRDVRERRAFFRERWGDWAACLDAAVSPGERDVFRALVREPTDFAGAVALLPRDELSIILSAYPSHLWNEQVVPLVRDVCGDDAKNLREHPGAAAPYVFYRRLDETRLEELRRGRVAVDKMELKVAPNGFIERIERDVLLEPRDFEPLHVEDDPKFARRVKVRLGFTLPRGSFATIVVKRSTLS